MIPREKPPKRKHDYLKYWRTIYHYTKVKYNLTSSDLDMIIFLYSEPYFTMKTFLAFDRSLKLNRIRLKKLVENGWVDIFKKTKGPRAARYQISRKGSVLVSALYKQLEGGFIQEQNSPLYRKKTQRRVDKRHVEQIQIRNESIRQQQRRLREEQYNALPQSSL